MRVDLGSVAEVSGGVLPLLGVLAFVYYERQEISDFFGGVMDGLASISKRQRWINGYYNELKPENKQKVDSGIYGEQLAILSWVDIPLPSVGGLPGYYACDHSRGWR